VPLAEVERSQKLKLVPAPEDHSQIARLRGLRDIAPFALAYGPTAVFARACNYREIMRDGNERIELELAEDPLDSSFGTDMSYNDVSSDEIAGMRARRILLDEHVQRRGSKGTVDRLNDAMLESFVSGGVSSANRLVVKKSPIPLLASKMPYPSEDFVEVARLSCVMLLILSGAVERIVRLDLTPEADAVRIKFEGIRHKVYSNRKPASIVVSGKCPLSAIESRS